MHNTSVINIITIVTKSIYSSVLAVNHEIFVSFRVSALALVEIR